MQSFKNHRRIYPLHHLVLLPLEFTALGFTLYKFYHHPELRLVLGSVAAALFLITCNSIIMRQHYALNNQDRIIRLEMRLRYFELSGKRFNAIETQLSFGQIAALRFAGDDELLPLIERTLNESLTSTQIKKAVNSWQADHMRV